MGYSPNIGQDLFLRVYRPRRRSMNTQKKKTNEANIHLDRTKLVSKGFIKYASLAQDFVCLAIVKKN